MRKEIPSISNFLISLQIWTQIKWILWKKKSQGFWIDSKKQFVYSEVFKAWKFYNYVVDIELNIRLGEISKDKNY